MMSEATSIDPAGPPPVRLNRIGQIAIPVADVERATAFYRDVLGMRFLFSAPPALAFFDCGGIRLMLDSAAPAGTERHSSIIYYRVMDLDAAYEALRTWGVAFEAAPHLIARMPDHELWMAFLRDPDGNLIGLMSERRG
jgi:catechol 2,3-dioxygenase-like lactoylglutathione lyase family enzyme